MSHLLSHLPRLLILDADDSYTNNILPLISSVFPINSPQRASLENRVVVIRVGNIEWQTLINEILPQFDGLILGPGPGRPALPLPVSFDQDPQQPSVDHPSTIFTRLFSSQPLPALQGRVLPTLGICLGHQALGCAFGGKIGSAPRVVHGQLCELELEIDRVSGSGKAILEQLQLSTQVVRYNSLVVDPSGLDPELEVTAWARDGESRSVMGLSHRSLPFHGVQFHPESVCSSGGTQILRNFLNLVVASSHRALSHTYSDLPSSILRLSSLPNQFNVPSPLPLIQESTPRPLFQLRTHQLGPASPSPQQVFERLFLGAGSLGELWLDSADSLTARDDRFSHLTNPVVSLSYFASTRTLCITSLDLQQRRQTLESPGLWHWLRHAQHILEAATQVHTTPVCPPVGFLGYFGYELLSESLVGHRLPCRGLKEEDGMPDAELGFSNSVLTYDHQAQTWWAAALVRTIPKESEDSQVSQELDQLFGFSLGFSESDYERWKTGLEKEFSAWTNEANRHVQPSLRLPPPRCLVSEGHYLDAIEKAQQQIIAGESYELCLTTKFVTELRALPAPLALDQNIATSNQTNVDSYENRGHYDMYLTLREKNAAPYAAYVHFPSYDTTLLCSSPERFMRVNKEGWVDMKPIKGTARRVMNDPVADAKVAESLRTNIKERAENLMITDLIRHDLIQACEPTTVEVTKLIAIETAATVHSLVSTVVGKLRKNLNAVDALSATFPPGSMTGAPKLNSVDILDRLEFSKPRGIYSGILGFFALDGSSHFNVVIRTAVIRGRHLTIGGGGAITALSKKEDEWVEVCTKVESVMKNFS
ncbi:ADC synthase [Melampsora americana]|nr:ADC synthase [Melampsora americana]